MSEMSALAFIDTETTGVHPGRLPWEIAIIRREPSDDETTWLIQIEDVDLSDADPSGLKVGGFYQRYYRCVAERDDPVFPSEGWRAVRGTTKVMSEREAAALVERMTRGAHLVGAVPNFDAEVFDGMLRRHGLLPGWHYHLVDVEALAVGYLHGRRRGESADGEWSNAAADAGLPWRSDELSRAIGVEPPGKGERHTAIGDAKWAMRLYDAITGRSS